MFQLTAARRRLAALSIPHAMSFRRFNSQPPEGGWVCGYPNGEYRHRFNSQPPEGGWLRNVQSVWTRTLKFQLTAARRRLELSVNSLVPAHGFQLTAARRRLGSHRFSRSRRFPRFNSQPPEGGWAIEVHIRQRLPRFQLTAARRRLGC